jgi:dUTP pyrophosphatase
MSSFLRYTTENQISKLKRGTPCAAGIDLVSTESVFIPPRGNAHISTGIKVEIPSGFFGMVKSRSGLSFKYGLEVGAGVIDSDYRGEVKVNLHNLSYTGYTVQPGDRIAQMIIMPYADLSPLCVEELDTTERGSNGFGSTGRS